MPQNIPDLYSWIHDKKYNHQLTSDILESGKYKVLESNDHTVLIDLTNDSNANKQILLIDKEISLTIYVVQYIIEADKSFGSYIFQTHVCRDKKYKKSYLVGLAQRVFWDYLFPQTQSICTDTFQTDDGSHFWAWRIVEAFKNKLNVYFVNTNSGQFTPLKSIDDYDNNVSLFWGDGVDYQNNVLVITSRILDGTSDHPQSNVIV